MKFSWNPPKAAIRKAQMDGLEEAMRVDIGTDSKQRCPVDKGTLRGSWTVERGERSVKGGYGGSDAPYAIVQHEDLSLHHTVGEAKFLEKAVLAQKDKVAERVKGQMSKIFK